AVPLAVPVEVRDEHAAHILTFPGWDPGRQARHADRSVVCGDAWRAARRRGLASEAQHTVDTISMKLAAKLLLSLAGLALVAIAAMGWVEHRRRAELLALDIDQDQRVGHVLQESISALCADAGIDVCRGFVESLNAATPLRDVQWLWLRDISDPELRHDIETVDLTDPDSGRRVVWRTRTEARGVDVRYLYAPLNL